MSDSAGPAPPGARSVVAETISGTVITGDHTRLTMVRPVRLPPPDQVDAPEPVVRLPRAPTSVFVGREAVLARLTRALAARSDVLITQALHGLGGVGKSELALQYAHRSRAAYRVVWWITAESPRGLETGLAELAFRLVPEEPRASAEDAAAWALAWLRGHPGWLLVLDNVNEPRHIEPLLANAEGGHILVTSRRDVRWPGRTATLRLDVLAPADAVALITGVTGRTSAADLDAAAEIAAELGHLPLGLDQAAAYMRQNRISPGRYLDKLRRRPARLYRAAPSGDKAQMTMAKLWDITMEDIRAHAPEAVLLLRILAHYAPEDVPRGILGGRAAPDPDVDIDEALGLLASYSMVKLTDDTVGMHRLTQAVVRHSAGRPDETGTEAGPPEPDARDTAFAWLRDALPDGDPAAEVSGWPTWHVLSGHIEQIAAHYAPGEGTAELGAVLRSTSLFLSAQGAVPQAHALVTRAADMLEPLLGAEHPTTLACRHSLALVLRILGRLEEAEAQHRAVLDARARVLGPAHPDTLTSRNDLAGVLGHLGRWNEEETEHRAVLDALTGTLGPDHLNTVAVRNNLAFVLLALGRPDEAEAQHRAALDARARALGDDHPATLNCGNNLGLALRALGRLDEAEARHRATLEARGRVLGAAHPAAFTSRNNLGLVLGDLGRLEEAERMLRDVTEARGRDRGDDHPSTLISRNNLAAVIGRRGRWEESAHHHEAILRTRLRVLGAAHPATLTSRNNLAFALFLLGRLEESEAEHRAAVDARTAVLGPDHPATLTTRNNLACLRRVLGGTEEAEREHRTVLEAFTRALGPEHPNTAAVRANLAYLRGEGVRAEFAAGRFNLVNMQADLLFLEHGRAPAQSPAHPRWRRT
ncbi:tetratricopeptide repeat protein [Actinomadura algeriensis]|uniref:Tetratricopeptide (TPR) repeat protein n=1 Tax=Actinomadura algeriensis TaxID=1679523 RepID=A0ABR9JRG9_9ACTN|nr:tetratricopeptide repeat protein [Actinomadura algeriensis]MBE1533165.1 tetratricopeptide (TPR) repeat protein [Actinomadura algeriensis]